MIEQEFSNDRIKLWVEHVIIRNFTKRQLKILGFIYLFAIHNENMDCYIPTLASFENVGIAKTKIRQEIEKLEKLNVVSWDRKNMTFTINVDTENWKVDFCENYKPGKIKQIYTLNETMY